MLDVRFKFQHRFEVLPIIMADVAEAMRNHLRNSIRMPSVVITDVQDVARELCKEVDVIILLSEENRDDISVPEAVCISTFDEFVNMLSACLSAY